MRLFSPIPPAREHFPPSGEKYPLPDAQSTKIRGEIVTLLQEADSAIRTAGLKSLLHGWLDEMQKAHQAGERALKLCQQHSERIDILLQELARDLPNNTNNRCAMVALAGYGRTETYPHSDIDLMILCEKSDEQDESMKNALQRLLYPLWDIGLKISNCVHTPKSALHFARHDHTFSSALLEMRFLSGDEGFYQHFHAKRQKLLSKRGFVEHFLREKYTEKILRHRRKYGGRTSLEPNLKEGIGSLRDLHYIRWLSTVLGGKPNAAQAGIWREETQTEFTIAYGQLADFRLAQNFFLPVTESHLLQHAQPSIAEYFAFRHDGTLRPLERMMKLYFRTRSRIELLGGLFDQQLTEKRLLPKFGKISRKKLPASADGLTLLDYLWDCRQQGTTPHARVQENLLAARQIFRHLPAKVYVPARQKLRKLLCNPTANDNFHHIALLLHHSGIIGILLQDYHHIAGLAQTDGYHAYPVGLHTLQTLVHLHQMTRASSHSPHTDIDALLLQHGAPETLFFAALLHDIAKGRGGQHAKKGAKLAVKIAPLFGFDNNETAEISWLVRHHLLLSDLALRRDILDEGTAQALIEATPDARMLDLLYCLTVADIRAVAPNSWSVWKATVIARLHESAHKLFVRGITPQDRGQARAKAEQDLQKALPDMEEADFAAHIARCDSNYLLSTTPALQVEHARMLVKAHPIKKRDSAILMLPDPKDEIVRLVLYSGNYTGMVAHTVGVLTEAGYSIVTLKTFPYGENGALLTVWFHSHGKALTEKRRLERLKSRLSEAIRERYINLTMQKSPTSENTALVVKTKITIDNAVSRRSTVIEVQTQNRQGLLFDLANVLAEHRLSIVAAKIDTIGQRVQDVFYVRNRYGLKIDQDRHQKEIYSAIKQCL